MIRPIDIQEKEFGRAVRGYKEDDVNQFLDEITMDLERLLVNCGQTRKKTAVSSRSWNVQIFGGYGVGDS